MLSCNVNGLRSYEKRRKIIDHYLYPKTQSKPDIFSFQETHSTKNVLRPWSLQMNGTENVLMSHGTEHSRGVLLGFGKHLNCKIISSSVDSEGRWVVAKVEINDEPITIVALYMEPTLPNTSAMTVLAQVMGKIAETENTRVIICGDFNAVIDPKMDQGHGIDTRTRGCVRGKKLCNFMESHDLTDVWRTGHPQDRRFTSFSQGTPTRIDLVLASSPLLTHVLDSEIGTVYASDHAPLYIKFCLSQQTKGRGYWRIPSSILSDPVYDKKMKNLLSEMQENKGNLLPDQLLDFTKSSVRGESIQFVTQQRNVQLSWTKQVDADLKVLTQARDKVQGDIPRVKVYTEQIRLLQVERDELISSSNQQKRWYNAARKHYELNRPTKYYYRLPGSKYDSIKRLQDENGQIVTDSGKILDTCHRFYSNLYRKKPHPEANDEDLQWKFLQHIGTGMSADFYESLDAEVTIDELKNALDKMKVDTAPGFDGITVAWYKKFWKQVAPILFQAFKYAFQNERLAPSQRRGILRLIPKPNRSLLAVRDWRPITLLPVDYKILSKALAIRLSLVIPSLVHGDQRGFIKGRFIGDNIFDVYSIIAQAEMEEEEGVLMLLDIEKAFDSVSLSFLQEVLDNFNFPESFKQWVRILYTSKELRIINNGHLSKVILPTNGLAQGDGLSPLLFVLTIETLAANIRANDKIEGFKVNSIHKKLALLADDMILSIKAKQTSFKAVMDTLIEFNKISNLHVNVEKTAILPIGPKKVAPQILNISPFTWNHEDSFNYLGVSVYTSLHPPYKQQPPQFDLLHHVESILRTRNTLEDVILGRVQNVRAFVGSKMTYYFAFSPTPPKSLFNKIQSIIVNYIWSFGWHPVNAKLLYQPFDAGGLGLYSLYDQCLSLKFKALNKLFTLTTGEYWQQYLESCFALPLKHVATANFSQGDIKKLLKPKVKLPPYWLQALQEWSKVNYRKPNECSIDAHLIGNSALGTAHVFRYKFMKPLYNKGIVTIQDLMKVNKAEKAADLLKAIVKKRWSTVDFGELSLQCDLSIPITTKAIRKALPREEGCPSHIWTKWARDTHTITVGVHWKLICRTMNHVVSMKLRSFMWKFLNRAIPTNMLLHKMGRIQSPECGFCKASPQFYFHLFWECPEVQKLWKELIKWCQTYIDPSVTLDPFSCLLTGFNNDKTMTNVLLVCKYYIHVQRIFNEPLIFQQLLYRIKAWRSRDHNAYAMLPYLFISGYQKIWKDIPNEAFQL